MTRWLTWLIAFTVVLALVLRDPMLALVALLLALPAGLAALWDRYAVGGHGLRAQAERKPSLCR